ncbi:hypothetical protein LEP3755_09150 [Leptolyngbya sp. NIES-3755]|nr:hypothetical protein LEP3755_09150 [Leptolyngbya sp. NIES-3755]
MFYDRVSSLQKLNLFGFLKIMVVQCLFMHRSPTLKTFTICSTPMNTKIAFCFSLATLSIGFSALPAIAESSKVHRASPEAAEDVCYVKNISTAQLPVDAIE